MKRHKRYQEMLVVRDELTPIARARLDDHVEQCAECQRAAALYAENARQLGVLAPSSAPPALRRHVLQQARQTASSTERSHLLRTFARGVAVVALVLGASWFSTPLGSWAATEIRSSLPAAGSGPYPSVCNGQPWVMLSPGMLVLAPRYYRLSGGQLLPKALAIAQRDMPHARYWAIYGYETRVGLCRPGIARTIIVGLNAKAGTELVAVDVRPRTP